MYDWPIVAPLLTALFGMIVLLMVRFFGQEKLESVQWKTVLFVLAAAIFQLGFLAYEFWGVAPSGLLRLDGLTTHLSLVFMLHLLLQHIIRRFDRVVLESESYLFQLLFLFFGLLVLMAENLLLYVVALPAVYYVVFLSPALQQQVNKRVLYRDVSRLCLVLLAALVLSIGAIIGATDEFGLTKIMQTVSASNASKGFTLGWGVMLACQLSLLLLPPASFFISAFKKSQSWFVFGYFRMGALLLGALLVAKWMFLTALRFETSELVSRLPHHYGYFLVSFAAAAFFVISFMALFTRRTAENIQAVLTAPLLAVFISYVGINGDVTGGQAFLYLFVLSAAAVIFVLSENKISVGGDIGEIRSSLHASNVSVVVLWSVGWLACSPYLTKVGHDILYRLVPVLHAGVDFDAQATAYIVGSMFATSVIIYRLIDVLYSDARRNNVWDARNFSNKMWSYALMLIVLILGVFPAPLYKYVVHSVSLFVMNAQ